MPSIPTRTATSTPARAHPLRTALRRLLSSSHDEILAIAFEWALRRLRSPQGRLHINADSSDHRGMAGHIRTYRFILAFDIEPDHPAYDDPEWAADAAWGTLSNEYGLRAVYSDIEEIDLSVGG